MSKRLDEKKGKQKKPPLPNLSSVQVIKTAVGDEIEMFTEPGKCKALDHCKI